MKDYREEDRRHRERLERMSGGGVRAYVVNRLNGTRAEKFSSGQASPVEPDWLTTEAMRTIAAARVMASRYF